MKRVTIQQASRMLNLSRTALYNRRNHDKWKQYFHKPNDSRGWQIDEEGVKAMQDDLQPIVNNVANDSQTYEKEIALLREQIEILKEDKADALKARDEAVKERLADKEKYLQMFANLSSKALTNGEDDSQADADEPIELTAKADSQMPQKPMTFGQRIKFAFTGK